MFVLSKVLKFVPLKPLVNKYSVINDCEHFFFCSLRWTSFLGHTPKRQVNPNDDIFTILFCSPNHREPPRDTYPEVECYIHKCFNDIRKLKFKPPKTSNLTPDESAALINPQKRDDIDQLIKEGNDFFNYALNTLYLRLYGVRHTIKDHSDIERGNPLPRHLLHQSWSTGWNEK